MRVAVGVEGASSNTTAASQYSSAARAPHLKMPPSAVYLNEETIGVAEAMESIFRT
jgi:hypothetical protein